MWKEEKLRELGQDVEMEDENQSLKKKHRDLFYKKDNINNVFYDSEYDDESDSDEDDSDD